LLCCEDVDGRDKPGHDVDSSARGQGLSEF